MEVLDVVYSATVRDTENTKVVVTTMFFGGTWTWYAKCLNYQNDALLYEIECDSASYWLSSQDALDAGIVSVMGGELLVGAIPVDSDNYDIDSGEYVGEQLPTGWDAADYKSLHE